MSKTEIVSAIRAWMRQFFDVGPFARLDCVIAKPKAAYYTGICRRLRLGLRWSRRHAECLDDFLPRLRLENLLAPVRPVERYSARAMPPHRHRSVTVRESIGW